MRDVPPRMTDVWLSGKYTGPNRPICRATIQRTGILSGPRLQTYSRQRYSTYLFGNGWGVFELPNIKSCAWQRSVEMDAGTCTLVLYNAKEMPVGQKPGPNDFLSGQPGYFTFNRGDQANPWDHFPNFWTHRLYPDMLVRTYEGYGYDPLQPPEQDPNLLSSGVWLIDQVVLSGNLITLKMRDAARLLLDEIAFPPVVPTAHYPDDLVFTPFNEVANPPQPVVESGGGTSWIKPKYYDDSGTPYNGKNGSISGHRPSDAFDGSNSTYWLSIGNASPTADYAYEWVSGSIPTSTVAAIRVYTKGGPYRIYVSLHQAGGDWLGSATIPYNPRDPVSAPNGADIPYVQSGHVAADSDVTIDVRDTPNIDGVRITLHDLWDSNTGTYQYRAAVRDVDVLVTTVTTKTVWVSTGTHWEGNYADYSDIVKLFLAYGGFLWPAEPKLAFQNFRDGRTNMPPPNSDSVLLWLKAWYYTATTGALAAEGGTALATYLSANRPQMGDLWADIEQSGTFGPAPLTSDIFDKKPLMDGIAYIRDMLGFVFWIDEDGGAQFRSQNIWALGNNVRFADHRWGSQGQRWVPAAHPSDWAITIHEQQTIKSLVATLDSKNVRERVIVANVEGNIGAVTQGFRPYSLPAAGMRRVAIWSDQHFKSEAECQVMADLIAVRQLFTYRTDTVRIPGYGAIQVDDQVKLVEEVAEEVEDIHYVKGISSSLDMSTGEFWYDLDTHWLGRLPYTNWAFNPASLSPVTLQYLTRLGRIT